MKGDKEKLKSRKRQRENRRAKQREERIDKRNDYGIKDLTAYNAVLQIKTNGMANIVLRRPPVKIREGLSRVVFLRSKSNRNGDNEEYGKDNNERAGAVRTDGHLPAKGVYYRSTQTKTGFTTPHFS